MFQNRKLFVGIYMYCTNKLAQLGYIPRSLITAITANDENIWEVFLSCASVFEGSSIIWSSRTYFAFVNCGDTFSNVSSTRWNVAFFGHFSLYEKSFSIPSSLVYMFTFTPESTLTRKGTWRLQFSRWLLKSALRKNLEHQLQNSGAYLQFCIWFSLSFNEMISGHLSSVFLFKLL